MHYNPFAYSHSEKDILKLVNNRPKVDIQNRLVCFDIMELGNQLKKIGDVYKRQVAGRVP